MADEEVDGLTVDPDRLLDTLESISGYTGTATDAAWQHVHELDPFELDRIRKRQKVYLGRYGRQPLDYWDAVEVTELLDYVEEVASVIKEEGALARESEDRG